MVLAKRRGRLFPGILAAAFAGTTAVSIVLTAILLDAFLIRYDRGSVTTMLPSFVYASALILKLGLVEAAVLGVTAFVTMAYDRNSTDDVVIPRYAVASIILPACAPIVGTFVILVSQIFFTKPDGDTFNYFAGLSWAGAVETIAVVWLAAALALASLVKRERPMRFAVIGLVASVVLLALFFYWQFYKFGFDQDRWNNI